MHEAGMQVSTDALCRVFGRYEGQQPNAPAILLGSHLDTVLVRDATTAPLAYWPPSPWSRAGARLQHAIEVAARRGRRLAFPTHILTSSALIGAVNPDLLDSRDADGVSVREAVAAAGGNADNDRSCARKPGEIAAYLELHIEQGPVLEKSGLALGVVAASNGSVRLFVTVSGFAGHAGTVPMSERCDALMAASEMLLAIERLAAGEHDLVATVGQIAGSARRAERDSGYRHVQPRHAQPKRCCARAGAGCLTAGAATDRGAARRSRRGKGKDLSDESRHAPWAPCHRCRLRGDRGLRPDAIAPGVGRRS
jgi:allantoate deiminase